MINPKDKKLIRDFIDYVAHDGDSRGYILVDKGHWSNSSMWHKQSPPKGEKTILKLKFSKITLEIEKSKQLTVAN